MRENEPGGKPRLTLPGPDNLFHMYYHLSQWHLDFLNAALSPSVKKFEPVSLICVHLLIYTGLLIYVIKCKKLRNKKDN